jgi:transposase
LILSSSFGELEAGSMARPYSDDLRRKLLEAHDQGKGTLAELADRFGVSLAWAWKISSARKRTGSVERLPYQAGPKVRVDREAVRRLVEAKPDRICANCRLN